MKLHLKLFLSYLILISASLNAWAQNCKYVEEKKDPFTNESLKTCKVMVGYLDKAYWPNFIYIEKKGPAYSVGFIFQAMGVVDKKINTGDKILIKLSDDKLLEIVVDKDFDPIPQSNMGAAYTMWDVKCTVDIKTIKKLANHDLLAIKVNINGSDIIFTDIKPKIVSRLRDSALCLVSE